MKRYIRLKNNYICYTIVIKDKKNISIKITTEAELIVYVPIGISSIYIENLLIRKQDWIIKNINKIKNSYYYKTNKVIFLGDKYIKKIVKSNTDIIDLVGNEISIKIKNDDIDYINKILQDWYIEQAENIIINRAKNISLKSNLIPSKIIIKDQKSRWGSCNNKKEIRLNWRLILMPYKIIDYIIVHELCHLKQMNHSKDFWKLVESIIPDYKLSEKWLKENGHLIINI